MSASGTKRTWRDVRLMSAFGGKADIAIEGWNRKWGSTDVRHPANTIEDMRKLLLGYRDNMRVEIESRVAVTAKTVADLRALPTWPEGLVLDEPRLSVVRVERTS
jgi:hypothetical protein